MVLQFLIVGFTFSQQKLVTPQQQIYSTNIVDIQAGVDKIENITLHTFHGNYPFLIHVFTFSDGSTYSLTTLIQ